MPSWKLCALVVCAVVVTLLILLLDGDQPLDEPAKAVQVGVEDGTVSFAEETLHAGDEIVAYADRSVTNLCSPVPSPTETPAVTPEPTALPPGDLAVRLVDALGEAIPNGVVEVTGKTFESAWSEFVIHDVTPGTYTVAAQADGYHSATETVQVPAEDWETITLEYLCEFVVEAQDENGNPVQGAQVSLFEGAAVQRPVRDSLTVVTWKDAIGEGSVTLRRRGREICVDSIEGAQSLIMGAGDAGEEKRYYARGDVVVGLGLRSHEVIDTATPLKLWDSICVLRSDPASPKSLKIKHGTKILTAGICGQKQPGQIRVVSTLYTDRTGKCKFENVRPGLYYAVAEKINTQSDTWYLCPVGTSVSLTLWNKNNNSVMVSVYKAGSQYSRSRYIARSDVRLSGLDSVALLSGNTGVSNSIALKPVLRGRYELTVTPPADLSAQPPSKTMEIVVDKRTTYIEVEFDVDVGATISGIVLREDTKEPVPDYPVELMVNRASGRPANARWKTYAGTMSDSEGRFEFKYVLPGGYMITSCSAREHATGYLHSGKALRFCNPEDPQGKPEPHFEVTDKDITGVVYTVLPGVRTLLNGSVVTENGTPVADVEITVDRLYDEFIES
ncbi:MAG: hypothetical protein ABIH23_32870, partial [bacterium]